MSREIAFGTLEFDLLDLTDEEGRTALHIACLHNAVDSVRYLLKYYEAVVGMGGNEKTQRAGCAKCCKKTYNLDKFVNGRDKYGNTPLVMASKCLVRNTDQTALLQVKNATRFKIKHAAVKLPPETNSSAPRRCVCMQVVHELLEYGACPFRATNAGNTVLHWAARENMNEVGCVCLFC